MDFGSNKKGKNKAPDDYEDPALHQPNQGRHGNSESQQPISRPAFYYGDDLSFGTPGQSRGSGGDPAYQPAPTGTSRAGIEGVTRDTLDGLLPTVPITRPQSFEAPYDEKPTQTILGDMYHGYGGPNSHLGHGSPMGSGMPLTSSHRYSSFATSEDMRAAENHIGLTESFNARNESPLSGFQDPSFTPASNPRNGTR